MSTPCTEESCAVQHLQNHIEAMTSSLMLFIFRFYLQHDPTGIKQENCYILGCLVVLSFVCNILPAFGNAVFNGLIQQLLVSWHLGSSQDERRVSGGILGLVLVDGCRMGNKAKSLKVTYAPTQPDFSQIFL